MRDHLFQFRDAERVRHSLPALGHRQVSSGIRFDLFLVDQESEKVSQAGQASGHSATAEACLQGVGDIALQIGAQGRSKCLPEPLGEKTVTSRS